MYVPLYCCNMVYMYIIDSKWRKEEMVELREKERATDQLFTCMSICTCTQLLHVYYMYTCILHVCMSITCTHVYCMYIACCIQ